MATISPDSNSKARAATPSKEPKKPLVPPEPKFWKRYSPHHEFPLSLVSSIFLHVLVFGVIGLIITGALLGLLGLDKKPPETDTIVIAGGGGNPLGNSEGTGHIIPQGPEAIQQEQKPAEAAKPDVPSLEEKAKPEVPKILDDPNSNRVAELAKEARKAGQEVGRRASEAMQASLAPKGKGGPGKGGGQGSGIGTGTGSDAGPGAGRISTKRQKRNNRWILNFRFATEDEYLHQLESLGAMLAYPKGDGQFMLIRDLSKRPVQAQPEDIRKIDRIRWSSDAGEGREALASVLGISPAPPYFIAIFPIDFENLLREREKERYSGDEDNIDWTRFDIVRRGGHYEPIVQNVKVRGE